MRRPHLIAALLVALTAAPYSSAQKQVLPLQFGSWSGQPSPMWVETEAPLSLVNIWKETGRTTGEYCQYTSGGTKLDVSLEKYRDPSNAYEAYTALIRSEMHPSTLGRTSAVEGDKLIALLGGFILELRPTPAISDADLATLVRSVSGHADQTPLPPIRAYLPRGFTDGTQRYARGPAGFRNAVIIKGAMPASIAATIPSLPMIFFREDHEPVGIVIEILSFFQLLHCPAIWGVSGSISLTLSRRVSSRDGSGVEGRVKRR